MKSQYPFNPITYQNSEPSDYLKTYSSIRQVSIEKAEDMKTECLGMKVNDDKEAQILNKEEDNGLASFFYTQSFTLSDED